MHSDLKITDGVYAILSNHDVKNRIVGLGKSDNQIELLVRDIVSEIIIGK